MRHGLGALSILVLLTVAAVLAGPPRARAESALTGNAPDSNELPVSLVADAVAYDPDTGIVTASGSVEVYFGERTLTADHITYDSNTGQITAEGKIIARDSSGATVFASAAELDDQLRTGLIRGARSVMGENARLSAVEGRRINDRYNALSKAVYSPCKVCADKPTPLWRIRARRVIQDEEKKLIHYEDATIDLFGVPVAWLPYFSHPDPTAKGVRASGFLVPEFSQSSIYGWGVQVPYYWVIDDYSDATFLPFVTTGSGVVLGAEYRRAFTTGRLRLSGSITRNDYQGSQEFHGHLKGDGLFDLPDGYRWGFDGEIASDKAYLRRYDISEADRLTSELFLRRYNREGFFDLTAVYFQSLRDNEPSGNIPVAVPDFDFRRELPERVLGGEMGFFASSEVLVRGKGRDTTRFTIGLDWERERLLPSGLVLRGFASARGDLFLTDDLSGIGSASEARLAPLAGVEARFPLIAETSGGAAHVLEPIAQAIVAPYLSGWKDTPNEDSLVTEFDETNLFDTSHFSGWDGFEQGPRLNLGLRYERIATDGLRFDATVGRVLRFESAPEFSPGSGLRNAVSDWVGAWSASYDPYVTVRQRLRIDDDFSIHRNEVSAELSLGPVGLLAGYTFLAADPTIEVPEDREELTGRASLALDRNWTVTGEARRNLRESEFVEIGAGLAFVNECCAIDLFVKRRFTESDDAPASTTVGVQLRLFTLGNGDTGTY